VRDKYPKGRRVLLQGFILSCLRAGQVSEGPSFCGDEGTYGFELAVGVGVDGGHLGRSAWAWRLLKPNSLVRLESPLGARREVTHAGGGSQPE
jgi:hypothetical protein